MVKKYSSKSAEITSVFLRQKNSKNDFRLKTTVHVNTQTKLSKCKSTHNWSNYSSDQETEHDSARMITS